MPYVTETNKSIEELGRIENELYGLAAAMSRVGISKVANELKDMADRIKAETTRLSNMLTAKAEADAKTANVSKATIMEAVSAGIAIGTAAKNEDPKT